MLNVLGFHSSHHAAISSNLFLFSAIVTTEFLYAYSSSLPPRHRHFTPSSPYQLIMFLFILHVNDVFHCLVRSKSLSIIIGLLPYLFLSPVIWVS